MYKWLFHFVGFFFKEITLIRRFYDDKQKFIRMKDEFNDLYIRIRQIRVVLYYW